jgi:hypothetical protein
MESWPEEAKLLQKNKKEKGEKEREENKEGRSSLRD